MKILKGNKKPKQIVKEMSQNQKAPTTKNEKESEKGKKLFYVIYRTNYKITKYIENNPKKKMPKSFKP
jgi:hypothetical protein